MLRTIAKFATNLMGSIPVLRNFVSTASEDKNNSLYKSNLNQRTMHTGREISEQGFSSPLRENSNNDQKKTDFTSFKSKIDNCPLKIFHPDSDYLSIANTIKSNIRRVDGNVKAEINFNQNLLKSEINTIQSHLSINFQEKITNLNQSKVNLDTIKQYLAINKQYLIESIRLSLETQNIILNRVLDPEIAAKEADVAKAFKVSQRLSQQILTKAIETYLGNINLLPSVSFSNKDGDTHLRTYVNNSLEEYIRIVFLGSQFGIQDKDLVMDFMDRFKTLDFKNDVSLFNSLLALTEFQKAIQGSILQDSKDLHTPSREIAEIDHTITKTCLKELLKAIVGEFKLRHNDIDDKKQAKELEILQYNTQNLQNFLRQVGVTELSEYFKAKKASKDTIWSRLGFHPKTEERIIDSTYQELNKTLLLLGQISEENLNGSKYHNLVLEVLNDGQNFNKHFKRILFETKALAAIDAISTFKGRKPEDLSFLEKNNNFTSAPWLAEFYKEAYKEYSETIKLDKSQEKTMDVAEELSNLGHQLHKIGQFSSDNFFERYKIGEIAEKMLENMGELTEVGFIAIMIDLYSNLFSYLNTKDENSFMSLDEISQLKRLVRHLRKISIIKDQETGEVLFNPSRPNKYAEETYNKMAKIIGSQDFLMSETKLILDFFNKAIEDAKKKKLTMDNYSILDAKHTILATWLLYILVKFSPKESNDIGSLKARIKVMETLFNDNLQQNQEMPSTLGPKITKILMGHKSSTKEDSKERFGIVTELCNELEQKIQDYTEDKKGTIALKDLLYAYVDVEKIIQANPNSVVKIIENRKKHFNNDKPLIKGLAEISALALEANPSLIVEFARNTKNPQVKIRVANELLNKIHKFVNDFKKNKQGEIIIKDSDEISIKQLSRILIYSQYLGHLLSTNNSKQIILRAKNLVSNQLELETYNKQINELDKKIEPLQQLLNSKILLTKDSRYSEDEEAFKGQLQAKGILLQLLSKPGFKIRPSLGNKLEWLTEAHAEKLKANQAVYSMSA